MMRVGALVSGRGSNLAALLEDATQPGAPYEIVVAVSNRPDAPALARCARQRRALLVYQAMDLTITSGTGLVSGNCSDRGVDRGARRDRQSGAALVIAHRNALDGRF